MFLVDTVGNNNPFIWASERIKRVVKSILAAESLSLVEAAAKFTEEILPHVDKLHITCKGLYDAVNTTNLISDK